MYYRKDRVPKSVTRPSKERKDVSLSIVFARRKKKLLLEGTFSIIKYLTPCHLQIPRKNYKDAQTQNGAHENQSISKRHIGFFSCASLSRKRRTGKFEVDAKPVIEFVKGWKARESFSHQLLGAGFFKNANSSLFLLLSSRRNLTQDREFNFVTTRTVSDTRDFLERTSKAGWGKNVTDDEYSWQSVLQNAGYIGYIWVKDPLSYP